MATRLATAAALIGVLAWHGPAAAVDVKCDVPGGDSAGWSVATGGDLDGDGQDDIAVGAPCAFAGGERRAGRAFVFSGADGRKLLSVKGSKDSQRLGASVAFVDDIDGDDRDEVVVGSFGWNTESGAAAAGKADVYTIDGTALITVEGAFGAANFGEAVSGIADVDGDDIPDFLVGAGDDRLGGDKVGRAYTLSGADGSEIDASSGSVRFDGWGSSVVSVGDIDGDQIDDMLVGGHLADLTFSVEGLPAPGENNGIVRLLSGANMSVQLAIVAGEHEDKMGRSISPNGSTGFFTGSVGADRGNRSKSGAVSLFDWAGALVREYTEPVPESLAAFGTAVTAMDDVDDEGIGDLVASSPAAKVGASNSAGRVHALSAEDGGLLWTLSGTRPGESLGQSLASGVDFDSDGVADVLIGAPGDDPNGRRGAGTVRVVSGTDGTDIMTLKGRRGLETRLFVAGWRAGHVPQLRSFNSKGRRREIRTDFFRRLRSGSLSIAVLDDSDDPIAGNLRVVLGTGRDAVDDTVRIVSAGRRRKLVSQFRGIGGDYVGGATVAAGNVIGDSNEEVMVGQASSDDGNAVVKIYDRFDTDPLGRINWFEHSEITAFAAEDVIEFEVNADGVNVAAGNVVAEVSGEPGETVPQFDEIIVAPISGAPVVRVMNDLGVVLGEWLAYAPGQNDGTIVTTGDLDGDGIEEIITAPMTGLPWVKAFSFDGTPFVPDETTTAVSFFAFPASFGGGIRLAVADVDLDGRKEIVVASGPGRPGVVLAFETDGTVVEGWKDFSPLGPGSTEGLVIASTDRFLRH